MTPYRPAAKTLLLSWDQQLTVTDAVATALVDQFTFHGVKPESFRVTETADGLTVTYTIRGEWRELVTVTSDGRHDYGYAMVRALNASRVLERDGMNYDSIRFSVESDMIITGIQSVSFPQQCPQCQNACITELTLRGWYECDSCKYQFDGAK